MRSDRVRRRVRPADVIARQEPPRRRVNILHSGGFAPTYYAIQTIGGKEIAATGNGGHYSADALHADATAIGSWEELRPVKCGDLGSGASYSAGRSFACWIKASASTPFRQAAASLFSQYRDSGGYTRFTTRRSVISPNELFDFVTSDLGSPTIFG